MPRERFTTWLLLSVVLSATFISRCFAADQHLVQITQLSGKTATGSLIELTEQTVKVKSDSEITLKRVEILRLDWLDQSSGLLENSPQLILVNGDRIGIAPLEITEEALKGSWKQYPAWPQVDVPLEAVRGVILHPPRGILERSRLVARLRDQKENQDLFYLENGDRLSGELDGLEKSVFVLQTAAGKSMLNEENVQAFGMNPDLSSFPTPKGPAALIGLEDGSQLTVTDLKSDASGILSCKAAFGASLTLTLDKLVSIQFLSDQATYLSELEPAEFHSTPYFSRSWPLRRNQNALGGPLRLGNREFPRGLGMHGRAEAAYDLKGDYAVFQVTIGVDAAAGNRGSVIFKVVGDNKPLFTSDIIRGQTLPKQIGPLNIEGIKRLTLSIDFADGGDILDHADWCDAVVIKKQ